MEINNFFFVVVLVVALFVLGLVFLGTDEGSFQEVSASLEAEVHSIGIN